MAAVIAVCGVSGVAWGQGMGAGSATPLPLVTDLKLVPVGSWSEYRIDSGQGVLSIRLALVGRTARLADVETRVSGGPVPALDKAIVRMSLPLQAAPEIRPEEQVLQLADGQPMRLPVSGGQGQSQVFKKLDPKTRVGVEKIQVPGGTFARAEHYRDKGLGGETVDFWVSKDVPPFGLLKVASKNGADGEGGATVTMELTAHGGGQKRAITRPVVAFDPAVLMKALPGAAPPGDGTAKKRDGESENHGGSAGPPLRPVPSPHPGMPPVPVGAAASPAKRPPSARAGGHGGGAKP